LRWKIKNTTREDEMTTRRDFIGGMTGAMAGVAFIGCELMNSTHAHAQPAPRRREVVVNGHRVKTVDVHAHCAFPDAMALMGLKVNPEALVEELADPKFHPFWAKAEELGCLVFIHPQANPDFEKRLKGNGGLINVIGNPLETTIALSHMIYEGTLDRFPGLKICAAHGGGYLPSYAARSDAGCTTFPERCSAVQIKKKPTEYLRQLYFDSIVFTSQALRHLVTEVGASQIVMGTDYPFPWTKTSVDHILNTPGLSDADRAAMLGDTAAKLLGIKS
jgi:aminocarboxymuconate-semialdehyde decarboxylase